MKTKKIVVLIIGILWMGLIVSEFAKLIPFSDELIIPPATWDSMKSNELTWVDMKHGLTSRLEPPAFSEFGFEAQAAVSIHTLMSTSIVDYVILNENFNNLKEGVDAKVPTNDPAYENIVTALVNSGSSGATGTITHTGNTYYITFPLSETNAVTNVLNGGTTGSTGNVERTDQTVTITFPDPSDSTSAVSQIIGGTNVSVSPTSGVGNVTINTEGVALQTGLEAVGATATNAQETGSNNTANLTTVGATVTNNVGNINTNDTRITSLEGTAITNNETGVSLSGTFSGTLSGDMSEGTNISGTNISSGDIHSDRMTANALVLSDFTANGEVPVGTGAGTFQMETDATFRASVGLVLGTDVQVWNANLDALALNNGGSLTNLTMTIAGLTDGTNVFLRTEANSQSNSLQTQITANAGYTNRAASAMQDLVDDTTPTLGGNLDGGGFVITNAEWQGTAVADAYLVKTGAWTGTFDGQEGVWYRDYANTTNKDAVVTNNETGVTLEGTFTGNINLTNGATLTFVWTCTNVATGAGAWTAASAGDFKADGSVAMTGDGDSGGNAWTNLDILNTDTLEIETGAAVDAVWRCTNAATGQGTLTTTLTNMNIVAYTNASTKLILSSQIRGTTNDTQLIITGVGFKPKGVEVLGIIDQTPSYTQGFVDSAGTQIQISQNHTGATMNRHNSAASYMIVSGGTLTLSWASWDADGATFNRTVGGTPTTNNIKYDFFFYR